MLSTAGTTRSVAHQIDYLEASLDPIRLGLLPEDTSMFMTDDVIGVTATSYSVLDSRGMEYLQEFTVANVELLRDETRNARAVWNAWGLCAWESLQSRTRFARIVSDTRRDALYTFLLRGTCRTGEYAQSCGHVEVPASQPSTSESCDVALEALCDLGPGVSTEISQRGITAEVRTAISFAEEAFSGLEGINIDVDQDPEIPERRTIRMTMRVPGEPEVVLKDECHFKRRLYAAIDSVTREMLTLSYEWVS